MPQFINEVPSGGPIHVMDFNLGGTLGLNEGSRYGGADVAALATRDGTDTRVPLGRAAGRRRFRSGLESGSTGRLPRCAQVYPPGSTRRAGTSRIGCNTRDPSPILI